MNVAEIGPVVLLVLVAGALRLLVGGVLSRFEDWQELAVDFSFAGTFSGVSFRCMHVRVNRVGGHCWIVCGSCADGLYLRGAFLDKLGRPPVLIPWNEISRAAEPSMAWRLWNYRDADLYYFDLGHRAKIRLGLDVEVAAELVERAGLTWPLRESGESREASPVG